MTIVNQCKTPLGKRLLKERILHPFINPADIIESYEWIDLFLKDDFYNKIRFEISKISDLEKSVRKMGIDDYKSDELFSDIISYKFIDQTLKILAGAKLITDNFFDNVIVNDENREIKKNRLELLQMFCKTYNNFLDFSKIEGA